MCVTSPGASFRTKIESNWWRIQINKEVEGGVGCGGLSSRPYEKRESRPRKNFSRPRGLQFGLIEVQSSKFIERFCKVFKDTENNTRGTREGTRTTQASSLVPPMRKNIAKTEKKRNTFVCGVWNRLNTCDAGSFL